LIVALHTLWLVSTLVEGLLRDPELPVFWPVPLALFLLVQPLRYWAIFSLGESWNTKIHRVGFHGSQRCHPLGKNSRRESRPLGILRLI
jgi:isoprenylcysteine carboxyl methyltransferase (ICMT) family protein YpbQ